MKTKKQLYAELEALVKEAVNALTKAEKFANKNKLAFVFKPAYGMGGTFYPKSTENNDIGNVEIVHYYDRNENHNGTWLASSHSC